MIKVKWVWDSKKRKMIKVMKISKDNQPIVVYARVVISGDDIEAEILGDVDEISLQEIRYEVTCPQCKTLTKIVGEIDKDVIRMSIPMFQCPDCHVEIPLVIRRGALK